MSCSHPITGYKLMGESKLGFSPDDPRVMYSVPVRCGHCMSCRIADASMWGIRCLHEASLYGMPNNAFATFTYKPESLPAYGNLEPRDMQLMLKRLRKSLGSQRIRFYLCGEYGGKTSRPHYHALLFNYWPADAKYWRKSGSGDDLYRSVSLEQIWPQGNVEFGRVTFQSAGYCARYLMKKIGGAQALEHYAILGPDGRPAVDAETGEILTRQPEFARMSNRPGIGAGYVQRYGKQIAQATDYVIVNGRKMPVPEYYYRWIARDDPERIAAIKQAHEDKAREGWRDATPARLAVREQVLLARVNQKDRERF